jgi:two-component system, NarL family, sensor histidine kinase DegS
MSPQLPSASTENPWEEFQREIENEYEQTQRSLREVTLMLEQSQSELTKLSQRNAAITAHLQQVQSQLEAVPRADIRMAYNAALEAQQRLFVMRGQMDKLQNDQDAFQRYLGFLEKVRHFLTLDPPKRKGGIGGSGASANLEMVINAQEAERQRLSRQMHDGPAQALSNFIVQTEIANRLLDIDARRAKDELDNLKNSAMSTFKEVRTFIFELRPMMLDDLGLFPTVRRYIDNFKEQTGAEVNLTLKGSERRLEMYLEVMIFRAIQELLGNAFRHNQDNPVKPQINIQIMMDENVTKISVADNGKGFDPAAVSNKQALGLKLIRERVELLGGYLDTDSDVGKGARITFQVPTLEVQAKPENQ